MEDVILPWGDASFALDLLCARGIECDYINDYRILVDENALDEMEKLFEDNYIDFEYC